MSRSSFPAGPDAGGPKTGPGAVPAEWGAWPAARRPWSVWGEARGDLRAALAVLAGLALAGIPAGLIWWWLAPRADFRVTADGPVPIGDPSAELRIGDDSVLVLVLAGLGLLAGAGVWLWRRRRGVAVLVALALGTAVAAVVAWQLGELLGAGPSKDQLAHVGARVTTGLRLGSPPVLAVAPFTAVLAYLVGTLSAHTDDLGRTESVPADAEQRSREPGAAPAPADAPGSTDAPVSTGAPWLADAPPPGRPAP